MIKALNKEHIVPAAIIIAIFIITISLGVGGYYLKRWWNWSWSYEGESIELIQEMVKPECLIGGNK